VKLSVANTEMNAFVRGAHRIFKSFKTIITKVLQGSKTIPGNKRYSQVKEAMIGTTMRCNYKILVKLL